MAHWSIDRTREVLGDVREEMSHPQDGLPAAKPEVVQMAILVTLVEILAQLKALSSKQ